jgi:nucleoside-diphosphate kinase
MMIKPEIVAAADQKVGAILAMANAAGFRILELSMRRLDEGTVREFYQEHEGKPFYDNLVRYIASDPVICICLEREDAVVRLRELVGSTDPAEAVTGTIRFLYGSSKSTNAVHASANPTDAARELELIFGDIHSNRS